MAHFVFGHGGGQQFFFFGRVDTVKAGPSGGGGRNSEVHFGGTGIQDHFLDFTAGGAAYHAVVHKDDAFALDQGAVDVQLQPDPHVANLFAGLNKGAAHVLVADDPHAVGYATLKREPDGRRGAAVWDRADQVCVHRAFLGQFAANGLARFIDRLAAQNTVGAAEIDVFENAKAGFCLAERAAAFDAVFGDHHHFAGFNFADKVRADDVQCAGFRRQGIPVADLAQHQRAHAQGIAHTDQLGACHGHNGKCAFDPAQGVFHAFGDVALQGSRHQVDDAFAVG